MENNVLYYKGYLTRITYDTETKMLVGKVEGINDLIFFETNESSNIEAEFHSAVDDYLEFCQENNLQPDKTYKGSFNVRIDPNLHKKLANQAFKNRESLNSLVEKALNKYFDTEEVVLFKSLTGLLQPHTDANVNTYPVNEWSESIIPVVGSTTNNYDVN